MLAEHSAKVRRQSGTLFYVLLIVEWIFPLFPLFSGFHDSQITSINSNDLDSFILSSSFIISYDWVKQIRHDQINKNIPNVVEDEKKFLTFIKLVVWKSSQFSLSTIQFLFNLNIFFLPFFCILRCIALHPMNNRSISEIVCMCVNYYSIPRIPFIRDDIAHCTVNSGTDTATVTN